MTWNLQHCSEAGAHVMAAGLQQQAFGPSTCKSLSFPRVPLCLSTASHDAVLLLTKVLHMHLWSTEELQGLAIKRWRPGLPSGSLFWKPRIEYPRCPMAPTFSDPNNIITILETALVLKSKTLFVYGIKPCKLHLCLFLRYNLQVPS